MSVRQRYSRRLRLGTTDIAAMLAGGRALKGPGFSLFSRPNAVGIPRFGVIVPKRVFPRAVDRNRMKRVLRELFRVGQSRVGNRDVLVRLTTSCPLLSEIEQCLLGSE